MKQLLFLLGSVGGFWMLAQRYRKAPMKGKPKRKTMITDTPINVGDGSFWVESPSIDDNTIWQQSPYSLRSPLGGASLVSAALLVNGNPIALPAANDDAVITVVYNAAAILTISAPEGDDAHVNIAWAEPYHGGFSDPEWRTSQNRWTYKAAAHNERITRILVDGAPWYRAKDYDTPGHKAQCELRLMYEFA